MENLYFCLLQGTNFLLRTEFLVLFQHFKLKTQDWELNGITKLWTLMLAELIENFEFEWKFVHVHPYKIIYRQKYQITNNWKVLQQNILLSYHMHSTLSYANFHSLNFVLLFFVKLKTFHYHKSVLETGNFIPHENMNFRIQMKPKWTVCSSQNFTLFINIHEMIHSSFSFPPEWILLTT